MMIKCQKCGFENQMGSIFCRDCGEKLDMDAIDPNKLQKDVNKEKNIKLAKKRIKGAISAAVSLVVIAGFVFLVFPDLFPFGNLRKYEEPGTSEAVAKQKFNDATGGVSVGKVKYSYSDINRMFKSMVVDPLASYDSFAKVTDAEIAYDAEKEQSVIYLWISIKDKVPVLYTIHGKIFFVPESMELGVVRPSPVKVDVKRLDIGRLPVIASKNTFLNGLAPLIQNEALETFFMRAKDAEFNSEGMTVEFSKGGPTSSFVPQTSSSQPSSATAAAALKGGSAAAAEKAEAARQKAEEEKEKKRQLEEERKRKAEEYKQQQKEKEEERKRKLEEEKERKKQEAEERKRKAEEEADRRRQEAEDRRREREERRNNNNNYNSRGNSRNSRSSRSSSRNRY